MQSKSQFFEWLPYSYGEEEPIPQGEAEREQFLRRGLKPDLTDAEALRAPKIQYALRSAKTAARFRGVLIEQYGEAVGGKVRFAEAFELCEYGRQPAPGELASMLRV